jgi:polyhydroxybutyrate depolymerase
VPAVFAVVVSLGLTASPAHAEPATPAPLPSAGCTAPQPRPGTEAVLQQVTGDVILSAYPCPAGAEVQLWSVIGGGHLWFGTPSEIFPVALVGADTQSISATTLIWDFFRAHALN